MRRCSHIKSFSSFFSFVYVFFFFNFSRRFLSSFYLCTIQATNIFEWCMVMVYIFQTRHSFRCFVFPVVTNWMERRFVLFVTVPFRLVGCAHILIILVACFCVFVVCQFLCNCLFVWLAHCANVSNIHIFTCIHAYWELWLKCRSDMLLLLLFYPFYDSFFYFVLFVAVANVHCYCCFFNNLLRRRYNNTSI